MSKDPVVQKLRQMPDIALREKVRRHLFSFVQYFWDVLIPEDPVWNWHVPYLCYELEKVAGRVFRGQPRLYDLMINIPPGTTKSTILTQMFPAWCWLPGNMPYAQFISGSYSGDLSTHHGGLCRDLITSDKYLALFPELKIRDDRTAKSDFQLSLLKDGKTIPVGSRTATSVGGTLTGKHGHFLLVDDPVNPKESTSPVLLKHSIDWMEQTLSTRKVDKDVSVIILIMQRLAQGDPSGVWIRKSKQQNKKIRHICLPGELGMYEQYVQPPELKKYYVDGLLDPKRMSRETLNNLMIDLGQYGYAGQIGQNPTPPGGGMFKADRLVVVEQPSALLAGRPVRYWDKAGTYRGGAYTAGVKLAKLKNGRYCVLDIQRQQLDTDRREELIRRTAEMDGKDVPIYMEQEPGSSGKDSVRASMRGLDGYSVKADRPSGDKVYRADPFSVQVNLGNVEIVRGSWNREFIEELQLFPVGMYKDQVDAASAAYTKLQKPSVGVW